jgi:hypothetical protein
MPWPDVQECLDGLSREDRGSEVEGGEPVAIVAPGEGHWVAGLVKMPATD